MDNNDFFTFSEYMKKEDDNLTASMEDYMEMIYRLSLKSGFVRIHELSDALNVQPPSATKMVQRLFELKLINYEKYGVITLNIEGKKLGSYLLDRHNIIENFLRLLGTPENVLFEETEKIEHTISKETVNCFSNFIEFMKQNQNIKDKYNKFRSEK